MSTNNPKDISDVRAKVGAGKLKSKLIAASEPFQDASKANPNERTGASGDKRQEPPKPKPPAIKFWKPSQLRAWVEPEGWNLVGDYLFQRNAVTLLGGAPGCGKSRALLWLAVLGAWGKGSWFGHEIHGKFKTLIVQCENGLRRLHDDLAKMDLPDDVDDWIRIMEPPAEGLNFGSSQWREALAKEVAAFAPDLVLVDPLNAACADSFEKDFKAALDQIGEIAAAAGTNCATGIAHHLRKPRDTDKHRGSSLVNLLAGSYVVFSRPRNVVVIQSASDDESERVVVVSHVKSNDSKKSPRSAWEMMDDGTFERVERFDWEAYDGQSTKPRDRKVTIEHLRQIFENGTVFLKRSLAKEKLMAAAKVGETTAYDYLKNDGPFADWLTLDADGRLGLLKNGPNE